MTAITLTKAIPLQPEQNNKFPAENLLSGKKWQLTTNGSNEAAVELLFQNPSNVAYIDIGYFNVAGIEIQACKSTCDYRTILPEYAIQTAAESKANPKRVGCKMFKEDLLKIALSEKWEKVRVIIRQPHVKNKPFGLEFVRISSTSSRVNKSVTNDATSKTSTTTSSSANWRMSNVGKLAASITNTSLTEKLTPLEERLFSRVTSPESVSPGSSKIVGRTAMLVLASRQKVPIKNKQETSYKNPDRTILRRSLIRETLEKEVKSSTPNKSSTAPLSLIRSSPFTKKKQYPSPKINKSPVEKTKTPLTIHKSPVEKKVDESLEIVSVESTTKPIGTDFSPFNHQKLPATVQHQSSQLRTEYSTKPKTTPIKDQVVEEQNDMLDTQIQSVKTRIKIFLKNLDITTIDMKSVTVKELRRRFEDSISTKLDRNGRDYFRKKVTQYLQQTNKNGVKRKSNSAGGTPVKQAKILSEMVECPICLKQIPIDVIMFHAESCEVSDKQTNHNEVTNNIHQPNVKRTSLKVVQSPEKVACPICNEMFLQRDIETHANNCAEISFATDDDVIITNNAQSTNHNIVSMNAHRAGSSTMGSVHPRESIMQGGAGWLSDQEKRHWEEFRKQPKPFHPRINKSEFEGHALVKCPSCGQYYRKCDIEEHSDDCASKVYSRLSKRGMYYVKE